MLSSTNRRIALTVAGGVLAFAAATAGNTPASATSSVGTNTSTITSTPDDGCPTPWARDTFTRTTVVKESNTPGTYVVTITDDGTFAAPAGGKTPGDAAKTFSTAVTGHLHGEGRFTVVGTPKTKAQIEAVTGFDNTAYTCKDTVPADRTTGAWPGRFFAGEAKAGGIVGWTWTYSTKCEHRTESEAGQTGNITGKVCASASASPSPSASASPSASPGGSASATPVMVPAGNDAPSLPVTGPGVGTIVGVGVVLVLAGGGLFMLVRRNRKVAFTNE